MVPEVLNTETVPVPQKKAGLSKIRRPERPSREALNEEVNKLNEEIGNLRKRVEEIKETIDGRQKGKNSVAYQIQEAKRVLLGLKVEFGYIIDERKQIREELSLIVQSRQQLREETRALREKLPFVRMEQIEEEIKRIEHRIEHTSIPISEEQKLLKKVEGLKKSVVKVAEFNAKSEKLSNDSSRVELVNKLKEKDLALDENKKKQEEAKKQIDALKVKENEQMSRVPDLASERREAYDRINELKARINELWEEFRQKEKVFREKEKEWREQQAIDRKIHNEKKEAEWKERQEIRRQRALENYVPPYTEEILLCDQLITYLQKFVPSEKETVSVSSGEEKAPHKGFENMQQISKNKGGEDAGGWFSGLGYKGKAKKSKGSGGGGGGKTKEKLSLSIDALSSFPKVGVKAPLLVSDVGNSLTEIKAKKEQYLVLQKEPAKHFVPEKYAGEASSSNATSEAGDATALNGLDEIDFPHINGTDVAEEPATNGKAVMEEPASKGEDVTEEAATNGKDGIDTAAESTFEEVEAPVIDAVDGIETSAESMSEGIEAPVTNGADAQDASSIETEDVTEAQATVSSDGVEVPDANGSSTADDNALTDNSEKITKSAEEDGITAQNDNADAESSPKDADAESSPRDADAESFTKDADAVEPVVHSNECVSAAPEENGEVHALSEGATEHGGAGLADRHTA